MQTEIEFSKILTHKRTGQKMILINTYGTVALCELVDPYEKKIVNMVMKINRAVCSLDNLC